MMYRIEKVLNHNTVIAIHQDDHKEVLIMGKGVGFGRKVAERIEVRPEDRLYSLQKYKERGGAKEIIKSIAPEFLELTNAVLDEAEKVFGKIDRMVLFPLADHIAFAVKRIQNHEQISNPLTEDIRVLFHMEFKVAESIRPLLKKQFQIDIEDEKVSQAMQMARSVRECISMVEEAIGKPIDIASIAADIEHEATIESLVKGKGFEECVAVISGESANVVVKSDTLLPNEVSQIQEIVYEVAGIQPVNLKIIEK